MNRVNISFKDRGSYVAGYIEGTALPVVCVFAAGGQIWASCSGYNGRSWSRVVRTYDGAFLLSKRMLESGNRQDTESVYLKEVQQVDDPKAFFLRKQDENAKDDDNLKLE